MRFTISERKVDEEHRSGEWRYRRRIDLPKAGKSIPEGAEGAPPDTNRSASSPARQLVVNSISGSSPSAAFSLARKSAIGSSDMVYECKEGQKV